MSMRSRPATNLTRLAITCSILASVVFEPGPARAQVKGGGLPDQVIGIRVSPLLLLSRRDIREDLKLTPEQTGDAERIISDLRDRALMLRGRNDAQARDGRAEVDRKSVKWLTETLSPEQRTRLDQLDLQWEGPSALISRPIVADTLGLSKEQRATFAKAVAERNSKRNFGPAVMADEAKLAQSVLSQLDEIQKERWKAMLGPACAFQMAGKPTETPVRR